MCRPRSVEAPQKVESAVNVECERRQRRIDQLRRELAARNRQLELMHRTLAAQLERARGRLAQGTSS